ncbi:MAG: hypothetical protein JWO90_840 [Solirubrobacterales bacterium]|jgi:rubrerythrin|nr:hypothetical protein [Solirubrobacterales bacterium]
MYKLNLDEIDPDGAIAEQHAAVEGDTRMGFLKKAGVGGAAAVSGGVVLSALAAGPAFAASKPGVGRPPASFGKGDIGILNYALTLEYLEAAFYTEALKSGKITDPTLAGFLAVVENDERKHVSFLRKALGSKAVKKPKFDFKGTNTDQKLFKATAAVLENTGVQAYFGQGGNIKDFGILNAAVSILTIEARHAGAIGLINGADADNITPDGPFDKPATAKAILKAVTATGFIVS